MRQSGIWRYGRGQTMNPGMTSTTQLLWGTCAALCLLSPAGANAQTNERLTTLEQGIYECSLPGDAGGKAWLVQEERNFVIVSASRYRSDYGRGTYFVKGDNVVFSRGPMKDMRFKRRASGLLQEMGRDGELGRLRCNRVARYKP